VQYADNFEMTDATVLTTQFDAVDGGGVLTATTPVAETTYWRAQISQGTTLRSEWAGPVQFFAITSISAAALQVTWNVSGTAARPIHLWHVDPPGPNAGDTVTVYGQGFPASGHLTFGEMTLPITSWQRIPANHFADTNDRVISGGTVDAEHYAITFTAPTYNGPGEVLTVEA
jgi:hypothetical protein